MKKLVTFFQVDPSNFQYVHPIFVGEFCALRFEVMKKIGEFKVQTPSFVLALRSAARESESIARADERGKLPSSNGKSPFLMGKSTINGHFQ